MPQGNLSARVAISPEGKQPGSPSATPSAAVVPNAGVSGAPTAAAKSGTGSGNSNSPVSVSISGGKMYIADTNNHRIQVVDMKTKDITTLRLEGVTPVVRAAAASSGEKK